METSQILALLAYAAVAVLSCGYLIDRVQSRGRFDGPLTGLAAGGAMVTTALGILGLVMASALMQPPRVMDPVDPESLHPAIHVSPLPRPRPTGDL